MPPNQFAHVTSCTPGVFLITSAWLVGMLKISDVDRIVTMRVAELAAATAANPSSTARSAANRNTATATLSIVNAVRRLLRRALLSTRWMNFIDVAPAALKGPPYTPWGGALGRRPHTPWRGVLGRPPHTPWGGA